MNEKYGAHLIYDDDDDLNTKFTVSDSGEQFNLVVKSSSYSLSTSSHLKTV